jgi:hypothetical protein
MSQPPEIFQADLSQDKQGQWWMTYQGQTYGPGHYPDIIVDPGRYAEFTMNKKKGADFDTAAPVSVAKGNAKPAGNGLYNQVTVTSVGTNVLTFHDKNTEKTDLNYVLHFNDGTKLDPIIKNGGGCCVRATSTVTLSTTSFAAYLALAFFIGVAVVLVARWFAGRSGNPA